MSPIDVSICLPSHFVQSGALIFVCWSYSAPRAVEAVDTVDMGAEGECLLSPDAEFPSPSGSFAIENAPRSEETRKPRDAWYSIKKSIGCAEPASAEPSLISSSVTCSPDFVAMRRFDWAGPWVIGLT